jgi:hypothetical protein
LQKALEGLNTDYSGFIQSVLSPYYQNVAGTTQTTNDRMGLMNLASTLGVNIEGQNLSRAQLMATIQDNLARQGLGQSQLAQNLRIAQMEDARSGSNALLQSQTQLGTTGMSSIAQLLNAGINAASNAQTTAMTGANNANVAQITGANTLANTNAGGFLEYLQRYMQEQAANTRAASTAGGYLGSSIYPTLFSSTPPDLSGAGEMPDLQNVSAAFDSMYGMDAIDFAQ